MRTCVATLSSLSQDYSFGDREATRTLHAVIIALHSMKRCPPDEAIVNPLSTYIHTPEILLCLSFHSYACKRSPWKAVGKPAFYSSIGYAPRKIQRVANDMLTTG